MPIVQTQLLSPLQPLSSNDTLQVYCGLDNCLTLEILNIVGRPGSNSRPTIYNFARALQGPVLEMNLRGWRINQHKREELRKLLHGRLARLDAILQRYAEAILTNPLDKKATRGNPQRWLNGDSPAQLKKLFYEVMQLKEQYKIDKGERKLSVDREALEKLELYRLARPVVLVLLAMRDISKQLQVIETEIDDDGRWRASYNIAGTTTGRFSSAGSSEGTAGNAQNITPELREMFEADSGWKLCAIDREQAESREVGWLCGVLFDHWGYYDAVMRGDIHTEVCRGAWPALPWTGDIHKDRVIAEVPFYRHLSRRDLAKKLGHGSNYLGQPSTMAKHAQIDIAMAVEFQKGYFGTFPEIAMLHDWIRHQLAHGGSLTNIWGRERTFYGRADDAATHREAMAFMPQSSTAERTNLGMWKVWKYLGQTIRLLGQGHDAIYFLYPPAQESTIIPEAIRLTDIRFTHGSRELIVPGEVKLGWNWAPYRSEADAAKEQAKGVDCRANPYGLKKFKPGAIDDRSAPCGMDRGFL